MNFRRPKYITLAVSSAFILMLSVTASAFAASYYVSDSVIDAALESVALSELVRSSVTNSGGTIAADAAHADFTLKPELARLGQAYILTVTRFRGDMRVGSGRQKVIGLEDLDEASDRAVRTALGGGTSPKDVRVGEIQERDERRLSRRMEARHSTYFGLGPATFANLGTEPLAYNVALGYNWEVNPYAMIRVLGDFTGGNHFRTYLTSAQLGLNYFFTDADKAPYVTGLLGFGSAGTVLGRAHPIGGLSGTLGAGYMLFRTSTAQLDLFLGYSIVFGNNSVGAPGAYGLRMGVYF